jgi:hypothetical protein
MALKVWEDELGRNLNKVLRWHAGVAALLFPSGEELINQAKPVIVNLLKEALEYWELPVDDETAELLMYLYPSSSASVWAAYEVVGRPRVAKDTARGIVRDAADLGLIGQVTWRDLEEHDPAWAREYKDQLYEKLIRH